MGGRRGCKQDRRQALGKHSKEDNCEKKEKAGEILKIGTNRTGIPPPPHTHTGSPSSLEIALQNKRPRPVSNSPRAVLKGVSQSLSKEFKNN